MGRFWETSGSGSGLLDDLDICVLHFWSFIRIFLPLVHLSVYTCPHNLEHQKKLSVSLNLFVVEKVALTERFFESFYGVTVKKVFTVF